MLNRWIVQRQKHFQLVASVAPITRVGETRYISGETRNNRTISTMYSAGGYMSRAISVSKRCLAQHFGAWTVTTVFISEELESVNNALRTEVD